MMDKSVTIDVNENRHRYYFTREATQNDMQAKYGVAVKTIGKYYPNRMLASPACPPLAIQLRGPEQAVDVAVLFVNKVLEEGPPTMQPQPAAPRHLNPRFTAKLYLGLQPHPSHVAAIRQRILGGQHSASNLSFNLSNLWSNLSYISKTAGPGAFAALRGQGSGHVEPGMTAEQLNDAMHILVQCSTQHELDTARVLAEDLLLVVRHEYEQRFAPPSTQQPR